jgi:hypothetical protein
MSTTYSRDDLRAGHLPRVDWNAVLTGVALALIAQLLLALLGIGLGLASIDTGDVATTADARTAAWTGYIWWIASGILSAFIGGYVAGSIASRTTMTRGGAAMQGFVAWAVSILVLAQIIVFSTVAGVTGLAGSLAGPMALDTGRYAEGFAQYGTADEFGAGEQQSAQGSNIQEPNNETPNVQGSNTQAPADRSGTRDQDQGYGATMPGAGTSEQARRDAATGALLSFFGLLLGAAAAIAGAALATGPDRRVAVAS